MDDSEFLDLIYSHWAKTTGAENMYWMPEEIEPPGICETDTGLDGWVIWSVDEKQERELVASHLSSEDADFITAIHGCLADLVRRLHTAIDESARLDTERDEQEIRIAKLETDADERDREIADLLAKMPEELF